jgi:isopenicillin-N epimerase
MVDGAHAPGHIPLNITDIDADAYTGACHKWMCAPKGCSFLYVRKELQHLFDPLTVSWGYKAAMPSNSQFIDYHQMQGTRDFSAFLTVPKLIEFLHSNNWPHIAADCRKLAHSNYQRFCDLLNTQPLAPITDEFLGQMCSMQIKTNEPEKLQRLLYEKYKIEIPVMRQDDKVYLRYSINAFNSQDDLDRLYDALSEIIQQTNLLQVQ